MSTDSKSSPNRVLTFIRSGGFVSALAIFLLSLCTRWLTWQDQRFIIPNIMTGLVDYYRLMAKYVYEDGILALFDSTSRLADPDLIVHPPGWSLIWTVFYSLGSGSHFSIEIFNVVSSSISPVIIFLIARQLFELRIAVVAGLFAAFSRALAWNSVNLLPDSLSVLPILIGVYFFVRWWKEGSLATLILSGVFLGLSCWLRSNTLFIAVFFALAIVLLRRDQRSYAYAACLVLCFVATIAPITIRNWVAFTAFIPLSLGAGQTLLTGVGDYDREKRFGIPALDHELSIQEAQQLNRPEYANTLFGPDGVQRDRQRTKRFIQFVGENPIWFSGVVVSRGFSVLKLEPTPRLSLHPAIVQPIPNENARIVWEADADAIATNGKVLSPDSSLSLAEDGDVLLRTGGQRRASQFTIESPRLPMDRELLYEIELHPKAGRNPARITGAESAAEYGFTTIEYDFYLDPQGVRSVTVPLVLARDEGIVLEIANENSASPSSELLLRRISITDLGPASYTWARPLRFLINNIQRIFTTAMMLPLAFIGLLILIFSGRWKEALILSIVPFYFCSVQGLVHTEYRYLLAVHYFIYLLAAVSVVWGAELLFSLIKHLNRNFHRRGAETERRRNSPPRHRDAEKNKAD